MKKKYREDVKYPMSPFPKLKPNEKIVSSFIIDGGPFGPQMIVVVEETIPFRSRIRTK